MGNVLAGALEILRIIGSFPGGSKNPPTPPLEKEPDMSIYGPDLQEIANLKVENAQLRREVQELRDLIESLVEHDPQLVDDEIYVALDGWKTDARSALKRIAEAKRDPNLRRHKAPPGTCKFCDEMSKYHIVHHPSHDPSKRCESGRRTHCTCDTCW